MDTMAAVVAFRTPRIGSAGPRLSAGRWPGRGGQGGRRAVPGAPPARPAVAPAAPAAPAAAATPVAPPAGTPPALGDASRTPQCCARGPGRALGRRPDVPPGDPLPLPTRSRSAGRRRAPGQQPDRRRRERDEPADYPTGAPVVLPLVRSGGCRRI
ncbi:hypothetical protein HBB16_01065 [Pseudonocardia sp. MCCB 268]|nr:hypothetical protein [Pseudonocardia cytotoxica]